MKSLVKKNRIGLFGDVIIDKYKYYQALRLSPEGPAPIVKLLSESSSIGGAGNVAISIANLGLDVELNYAESINEKDENVKFIRNIALKNNIKLKNNKSEFNNLIPVKIRYYVDGKQFMREDLEETKIHDSNLFPKSLIQENFGKFDILVISDYQKGLISSIDMKNIILFCNSENIPLFIDTKKNDIKAIENSFCLKINESEFNNLFKKNRLYLNDSETEINLKVSQARLSANIKNLILTLGSRGSVLCNKLGIKNVKSDPVDVVDITGAGDSFLAGLIYSFSNRVSSDSQDLKDIFIKQEDLEFANTAASSVVVLKGTVPISKKFLRLYNSKIKKKNKIGFTNGCFDILHLGHLKLFKKAKEKCEYLIVGLNSDNSVRKLKGPKRPINDQITRCALLEAIEYIDEVIIFDEETPLRLIKEISPNLLVKGSDYKESEIVGSEYVKSYGGEVLRVNLIKGKSTTNTLKKIKI